MEKATAQIVYSFGNPHLPPGINPNQHTSTTLSLSRAADAVRSMLLLDESPIASEQDGGVAIGRQSLSPGDMVVFVVGSQEIMPATHNLYFYKCGCHDILITHA
mmetsp:Transcript_27299/g.40576  ORF Transcript_27299/g.40576 Transcript_27299/m.40576 type:complete len:104 (-) Transcript_27299:111-422(-)